MHACVNVCVCVCVCERQGEQKLSVQEWICANVYSVHPDSLISVEKTAQGVDFQISAD